jgi:diguanylate cyclase (GGDEF)-like protein
MGNAGQIAAAIAALGRRDAAGMSPSRILQEGVEAITATLGIDAALVLHLDEVSGHMLPEAFTGWPKERWQARRIPITPERREALLALADGPEFVYDMATRRPDGPMLVERGLASWVAVLIGTAEQPYGTIRAVSFTPRHFSAEEGDFVQAVANIMFSALRRAESEEEFRRAALHDETTGLPNRRLLLERLEQALGRARREGCAAALALVDLDHFKVINDGLGRSRGDDVIRAVAARLEGVARPCDTVARLGGDEFAIAWEGVVNDEHALGLAERVIEALHEPLDLDMGRHPVRATVGVVVSDADSDALAQEMIRDAQTAVHRGKERGGGRLELFEPELRQRAVERLHTESDLHRAIEGDELTLHYQPFFSMADGNMVGIEALVRWQHPTRGLVSPDKFIPLAEQTGLIVDLGAWVLCTATEALADLRARIPAAEELLVSVNVSARQLRASSDQPALADIVEHALAAAGLPPEALALEVTESTLMDLEDVSVLNDLKAQGVQTMLDDFGTGHSSLARLADVPLDVVKIDRGFVSGLCGSGRGEPIIAAIVGLAAALDLQVIAEGVETEDEHRRVVALGCQAAQGFLLARPMPVEQLRILLEQGSARRAA